MRANFALFLFVIFAVAIYTGWEWPNIAKIMPVYVAAIPGLIMISIQLYREVTGWEGGRAASGVDMDDAGTGSAELDEATARRRTIIYFGWFIGGAIGIWLLGIVIALPLLVFLYALVEGGEKWLTSILIGASAYALIWGLFEYMLETRWPSGLLFGY
jgi:hypothetical protein